VRLIDDGDVEQVGDLRATERASPSMRRGGSSSSSTRQVVSYARYVNSRSTRLSSIAASSSSPSSLFVG